MRTRTNLCARTSFERNTGDPVGSRPSPSSRRAALEVPEGDTLDLPEGGTTETVRTSAAAELMAAGTKSNPSQCVFVPTQSLGTAQI